MIDEIQAHATRIGHEFNPRTLDAVRNVRRHEFVPSTFASRAYEDRPLPIGHGQTISQPFMVAIMVDLLQLGNNAIVLEIGAGCGYQTAILASIAQKVCALEIVETLAIGARERLDQLEHKNVVLKCGDGHFGWPEPDLFDGIIVAAAGTTVPEKLSNQLKPGARMIMPLGRHSSVQSLCLVSKKLTGELEINHLFDVRFVPLINKGSSH